MACAAGSGDVHRDAAAAAGRRAAGDTAEVAAGSAVGAGAGAVAVAAAVAAEGVKEEEGMYKVVAETGSIKPSAAVTALPVR